MFMALLFLWMAWKKESISFIFILLITAGLTYILQDERHADMPAYSGAYSGTASFKEGYKVDGDTVRGFLVLEDGGIVYANYRFGTPDEKLEKKDLIHNSVFSISGVFEEPKLPSHEYAFDMARYLKSNGASAALTIEKLDYQKDATGFFAAMSERRQKLKEHIRQRFPESLQAEAEALLIGERETLSTEQQRIQQTLGISHLFAISGLHVGIISGLMYFLMIRLGIRKEDALIMLLVILPFYALLAGGAPSVWRAVSMTAAVLVFRLFKIRLSIAYILLLSFIFFIVVDPYVIYKIGFQLSYGASFGIIYSMRFLESAKSPIKQGLIITFLSQFTLYPILLVHFYGLSLSSFLVNSLFVPLYTLLILPINILLLLLTLLFQPAADFLFYFYEPFRNFLEHWTAWLAEWPNQMWIPGRPDGYMFAVMVAAIILFYSLAEKGFRWWKFGIGILPPIVFTFMPFLDGALRVTFIDVGQGDSALIELPHRRGVYLIDTGGVLRFGREGFSDRSRPFEIGRQVVAPYLQGNGISQIDALILSHPDADHAEGADEILQMFDVAELHMSPGTQKTDLAIGLGKELGDVKIRLPGRGSVWSNKNTTFTYLSPSDTEYTGNNDSLVLLMEYEEFKVLFTGDLEVDGENEILKNYGDLLEDTTILKVGHHGSKTSSGENFLSRLDPELSIFSTGEDNRYGHPAQEVKERFDTLSLPTLNTADVGTIKIVFQNGGYSISTME
ncbi:DNA internalization-related competence protein ComEC/Rec2 [Planococcus halotolerans]|uniref:DNA internalization-related competence protein ComEC/Rec2 n=1 Tax=Planococcus halotolerans TaxID=2233542 RepID=A0A365KTX1_9BACL|nr:DNA internalization-related competence protein ComEC/Rec2 [Planococcus halotolerans]RAZ76622.1 DNA internalization-related competence protein ComEC/Rec2 [Planococcus halotolerans]